VEKRRKNVNPVDNGPHISPDPTVIGNLGNSDCAHRTATFADFKAQLSFDGKWRSASPLAQNEACWFRH
jgi:hypothetical protein